MVWAVGGRRPRIGFCVFEKQAVKELIPTKLVAGGQVCYGWFLDARVRATSSRRAVLHQAGRDDGPGDKTILKVFGMVVILTFESAEKPLLRRPSRIRPFTQRSD
jgi:hypothetical protein